MRETQDDEDADLPHVQLLRNESWLLIRRLGIPSAMLAAFIGGVTTLTPVLIEGNDVVMGLSGALAGGRGGAAVAIFLLPLSIILTTGMDFDTGFRAERFLLGASGRILAGAQLVAAFWFSVVFLIACSAAATVSGLLDLFVRALFDRRTELATVEVSTSLKQMALALVVGSVLGLLTWSLIFGLRSGRKAVLAIAMLLASLFVLMLRLQGSSRDLILLHPLAGVWSLSNPFSATKLYIPWSMWTLLCSLVWALACGLTAWRGLPRPD